MLFGNGDGTFQPPVEYQMPDDTAYIAVGDFNGDGIPDLAATTNPGSRFHRIYVRLGTRDGTFRPPLVSTFEDFDLGAHPLTVGDFNGDGIPDLLTGGFILLGNGDGTFKSGAQFLDGALQLVGDGIAGDFNGDGNLDVAIVTGPWVFVFPGNGDDTFSAAVVFWREAIPCMRWWGTSMEMASRTWRWSTSVPTTSRC